MHATVVYFSRFGNTRAISEAIAETLASAGSVRVLVLDQLTPSHTQGSDLLVVGSPTHRMNLPEAVRPVFAELPRRTLRGTHVAAFDTSYKMSALLARFTAAKKLAQKLRKLGGVRVVPPETFYVIERQGPLYDGELERASAWAGSILERLGT